MSLYPKHCVHVIMLTYRVSICSGRSYHVYDFEVSERKSNGVGWSGNRQHESQ